MNDNDIIKALDILKEWQTLAYHNDDGTDEDSHELYWALTIVFKHISHQNAEIKRLGRKSNNWERVARKGHEDLQKRNAEAIKEFAERLCKDRASNDPIVIAVKVELEEMVGEHDV